MLAVLLLLCVLGCSVAALFNWRLGIVLCIVVGVLQDPIRKVTPGTPVYLTLSFVPIYLATVGKLWSSVGPALTVRRYYPQLITPLAFLTLALFVLAIVLSILMGIVGMSELVV